MFVFEEVLGYLGSFLIVSDQNGILWRLLLET